MSMAASLFEIMYTFSSALLYPVIIILVMLVLFSLIYIGEFLSEYSKRHRDKNNLEENCKKIKDSLRKSKLSEASKALKELKQNYMVSAFAKEASKRLDGGSFSVIEKLAEEYEIKMAKRLEKTKIVSTVSPMLGLMGTLIPLGPALIGLSQGDIETLANNLMIAFATTVVGLFAGSIGYVLTQVRRRWYWEDMSDIDYIMDSLEENFQVLDKSLKSEARWNGQGFELGEESKALEFDESNTVNKAKVGELA